MSGKIAKLPLAPLSILRQIRDVISLNDSAQKRLDRTVEIIAEGFASQVCSVYLLRAGDIMELFASKGLNKKSVHSTKLNMDQGIIGMVAANAEPVNISDITSHPKYEYFPETGEEIYNAFMAVPIFRDSKVIGVVTLQRIEKKEYNNEQIELLQTVSMVLSELAISGNLINIYEINNATGGLSSQQISGISLCGGVVKGSAVLHQTQIDIKQHIAADIISEKKRFYEAMEDLKASFKNYLKKLVVNNNKHNELIESYMLFTRNHDWLDRINNAIKSGLTAEAAIRKTQNELQVIIKKSFDPHINERIYALDELSDNLLRNLLCKSFSPINKDLPESFILVARDISAAELLSYDHSRLKGIVIEKEASNSHATTIARFMSIPVIIKAQKATSLIRNGDMLIVDADRADIYVRPSEDIEAIMDKNIAILSKKESEYESLRNVEAISKDGVRISLNINSGLMINQEIINHEGVDGIGLYRTELPYITSSSFPDEQTQVNIYSSIYKNVGDKRVILRSFDIGGDKSTPYLHSEKEENPAMGWRATRIGLDRPGIFRTQFRAMLSAASEKNLHIMLPFIAQISEFEQIKNILKNEINNFEITGKKLPRSIKTGVMIEIPSLLWQLDELMEKADFISIGSNDLFQFMFACDRNSTHMTNYYDNLSPTNLRVIKQIVEKADEHKKEVIFCGEMAQKPIEALVLIACGIRSISAPERNIGMLKAMITSLSVKEVSDYVSYIERSNKKNIRSYLSNYTKDRKIVL
ncbi:MAG: phosphoenolpyruvate--protein phosphotransferase [Rickettsiales bacterium]